MKKATFLFISLVLFTYSSYSQCTSSFLYTINGSTVSISADSSSSNPLTSTVSYMWDFGDGNNSTQAYPLQHTYQNNGFYQLCLIVNVTNPNGNLCVDTTCYSFWIGPPPASWDCNGQGICNDPGTGNGQYNSISACQANCFAPSWDCSSSGCFNPGTGNGQYASFSDCTNNCGAYCYPNFNYNINNLNVNFLDLSQFVSGSSITYTWDFGDGTTSNSQNPSHTYQSSGWYQVCLTISTISPNGFTCTNTLCDSGFSVPSFPPSWDCSNTTGCYDPGNGNGQFTTLANCQASCSIIPTWDCLPGSNFSCIDPGNGSGIYNSYAACTSACAPTWDCNPFSGCYISGLGGAYNSLSSCQATCINFCDSINIDIVSSSQNNILLEENWLANSSFNTGSFYYLWFTTSYSGNIIVADSGFNIFQHSINTQEDTVITCGSWGLSPWWYQCQKCDTLIWDGSIWQRLGDNTNTNLSEYDLIFNNTLLYKTDVLGRRSEKNNNKILFYIYDDGTVEKRITID